MLLGADGEKLGTYSLKDALAKADNEELDLMQLGFNGDVAICKILNYSSWLYHEQKKKHKQELKNKGHDLKCMNFRPGIGDNDFTRNIKKVEEFLGEQHKVKISVKFKSYRESMMADINKQFVDKIIDTLSANAELDGKINTGGRDINFILKPAKKR